jgi:opacity protein-like surface antigen
MRNVIVAGAMLAVAAVGTDQADARARATDWDGAYAGFEAGYGWGAVTQSFGNIGGPLTSQRGNTNQDGAVAGAYLGYNWLLDPRWLLGVEGNMDWTDIGTNSSGTGATNPVNMHWEGSFRGRFGFLATPSLLFYTTGGYSLIDGSLKALNRKIETQSTIFGGWTVGLGAEWALDKSMVLRLQYRYSDYGTQRESFPAHGYDVSAAPLLSTVTAGISFRF